jgi:hypothetical protein
MLPEKLKVRMLLRMEHFNEPENILLMKMKLERAAAQQGMELVIDSEEEFLARGRVPDCDCGIIQCCCTEARQHGPMCHWRIALLCPFGLPCDPHGVDVCPECDTCTCGFGR